MKRTYTVILVLILTVIYISTVMAEFWSSQVSTNSSSWSIYRQSSTLSFNWESSVEGKISPVEYHGRNLKPYHSNYKKIVENDVQHSERVSALEGDYRSEEMIGLTSTAINQINISVIKPVGSKNFSIFFQEAWPVSLTVNNRIEYSGLEINDRNLQGNNLDYVQGNFLYNPKLKREYIVNMQLRNMNASLIANNDTILSAKFMPNKLLDYSLKADTSGVSDLRYKVSNQNYDFRTRDYPPIAESQERYYGKYNISQKIEVGSESYNGTAEEDWLAFCPSYEAGMALNESNIALLLERGLASIQSGNISEAIANYSEVLEVSPTNATAWNQKGIALGLAGKYDEALESFDKAIQIDPQYAKAWHNKGTTLTGLGRYEEALEANDKAINIDRNNPAFWYARGINLEYLNRTSDAQDAFTRMEILLDASGNSATEHT